MVDKENPTLTIGYVSCPHPPFVINEEGGAVDYRNTSNWADKSLYLNQLKYVNACMENAVDGILQMIEMLLLLYNLIMEFVILII